LVKLLLPSLPAFVKAQKPDQSASHDLSSAYKSNQVAPQRMRIPAKQAKRIKPFFIANLFVRQRRTDG
jgi:hypothetical protein